MAEPKHPVGVSTKLSLVYEPRSRDPMQPQLEIFAVHGFGGHATRSWTSGKTEEEEECMWLRELLPNLIMSRIRVFSFGYAAHNVTDLLDSEKLATIADSLLQSVSSAREKKPDLPIAFVAHGFGGVIVKKALLLAQANKVYLSNIAQKCRRLIFFGTPHRASAISSSWEDLLLNALVASPSFTRVHPSSNVATHLKRLAGFVEDVSTKFATTPPRHIINVYQRVEGEADSKSQVVIDLYSATTGLVHETNLGRPSKHEDLCVFSGVDSTLSAIVTFLKAEVNPHSKKCLSELLDISPPFIVPDSSLDFYLEEIDVRRFKEITDWINNPSPGIITTTGSNRIGKGLLASAVFRELQKRSLCVAYYSFSFGGFDSHRASAPHLLASVMLQLMNANPERYARISAIHEEMGKSQTSWTQATLMVAFQALLDTKTGENPVYIVIDGLHRCDSSLKDFLNLLSVIFRDVGSHSNLKVALFYQERGGIKDALDSLSKFTVPGPVLGKDSLVKPLVYGILDHIVKHQPPLSHLRSEIQSSLARCADLAQLVMTLHCLRNITTTPSSIASAKALVGTYPPTLEDIASYRFQGLGEWGRKAIGWMCHARRPLSLSELVAAVAITDRTADFTAPVDSEDLPLDPASELEGSLGGLVMLEDGGIVFTTNTIKTHFRDLIIQDTKEPTIPADVNIAKILIKYLSLGALVEPVKQAIKEPPYIQPQGPLFDLVSYAMEFWSHHYSKNCTGGDQSLSKLLGSKLESMAPLWGCTPYLLAARLGLLRTLQTLEEDASVPTAAYKKDAIDVAGRHGHQDLVDHLLATSSPGPEDVLDLSDPLRQVSAHGYDAIAAAFLRYAKSTSTLEKLQLGGLVCRAAALGYVSQVKLFLQYGANVNATADGWTPLQLAVAGGHLAVVAYLLEEGHADVDAKAGAEIDPPILLAVTKGYDRIVDKLCKSSADISSTRNTSGEGHSTALHVAARQGDSKIARLLVSSIASASEIEQHINRKDEDGRTPLMVACYEGNEDIASLLLEFGALVDASLDAKNHSILFYAARQGISESFMKKIFKALGSVGALADIGEIFFQATKRGFTDVVTDCLSESPPIRVGEEDLVKHTDDEGRTALHHASGLGFCEIAALLLEPRHGTLVNPRDNSKDTPLSLAAVSGNDSTVDLLLDWGADPFLLFAGGTILNLISSRDAVCTEGHIKCMISILKKGVDPNIKDTAGRTALHTAASYGHLKLVEALFRHTTIPVDVEAKGAWQWNALHYAANSNEPDACKIAQLLIQRGIDPLSKDVDGWIPLHLAADADKSTSTDLLQLLWEHDRNSVDTRANDGRTALHFGYRRPRSVVWLLRHGADIDAVDNKGRTALMAAASSSSSEAAEAVRILLDNSADPLRVDSGGKTALQLAASMGAVKAGEALLRWAAGDVAQLLTMKDSDNCPALHIAILEREPSFAEMLLESFYGEVTQPTRSDVLQDLSTVRASTGETPVISAIKRGYQSVLKKLLDLGAETNARAGNGNTALLEALHVASDEAAMMSTLRLLLDPERRGSSNRVDVNDGDRVNPTALHQVARQGRLEVVKLLVEVGQADVNAVGGKFHTALTAAVHGGEIEIVNYLMEKGATQKLASSGYPPFLFYPLHAAAQISNIELISKLVIAEPESVDLQDSQGRTALHIAMRRGKYDSVVELFSWDARPGLFTRDHQGRTVLHHAVLGRDLGLVRNVCLVWDEMYEEEKLDVPDVDGWTALHWACRIDENERIVKALLRARGLPAVMEATKDGWTPESICAFHNSGSTKTFVEEQIKRFLAGEQDCDDDDDDKDDNEERIEEEESDGAAKVDKPESTAAESTGHLDEPPKSPPPTDPELHPREIGASSVPEEAEGNTESTENDAKEKNREVDDPNIPSGRWKVGEPDYDAICDGCSLFPVIGPRWRCRSCRDFDFCFKCMWTAPITHPGHEFLQISGDPVDPTDVSSRGPQLEEAEEKNAEGKPGDGTEDGNNSGGEGGGGDSTSEGEGEGSGSET